MKKLWRKLPNILIGIGLCLLLATGVYEGMNYPWMTLFAQLGWTELSDDLGDPSPLPDSALDPNAADSGGDELPLAEELFAARAPMNLAHLGVIKIPRIRIAENIVEGAGKEMLYAVGHVRTTAMPGQEGNCVLAAHRLYVKKRPFRYLDKMQIGDKVYVSDKENTYTYEVFQIFDIEPDDNSALKPQEGESHMLTLLTCTPVVNPTRRLLCWARLVETVPLES